MAKIIAEFCQNHKGDIEILKEMVYKAAEAGADYAKIQSMFSDDLAKRVEFEEGKNRSGKFVAIKRPYKAEYERLKPMDLSRGAHEIFIDECKSVGIKPMTTVFARSRIPFISSLQWDEIKVASYDCGSFPMIRELKSRFNHLYISTGATYDEEIEKTAEIMEGHSFTFLHCTTIYPTPLDKLNLSRMNFLRKFTKSVGFSDHSLIERDGINASIIALSLGADVIERHFTVLHSAETKDGPVSVTPILLKQLAEFAKIKPTELVEYVKKNIPNGQKAEGVENHKLSHDELLNRAYYRGRFASKVNDRIIFNWEEKEVF